MKAGNDIDPPQSYAAAPGGPVIAPQILQGVGPGVAQSPRPAAAPGDGPVTTAAAFFDLDGTLVAGQTTFLLVKFLWARGLISRRFLVGTGIWFLAYKARLVKLTEESRNRSASVLAGLRPAEVEELMKRFAEAEMIPRLHAGAVAALADHRAAGDRVLVLSAAFEQVVKPLCERLQVTDYVGASLEMKDCRYTGRLTGAIPYGEEKARVAARYMERWGVDPSVCWAYADHPTDIALLRSVGHPVAVRPKPALLRVARQAGWPILD